MKTREKIVKEIINETKKEIPQISNYRTGGVFRTFIEVVASFIEKFYKELEEMLPNRFLTTAKGEWLDLKAEELSLKRYPATKTRGYVIFSRASQGNSSRAVTIAKDKILATKPNAQGKVLRYKVVGDVILQENETTRRVLVEADDVGSQYNVIGGQIVELITPISGIDKITNENVWVIQLGKEKESNESLRNRCIALWQGLSGANKSAYLFWTKSVEGIGEVKINSPERGCVEVICVHLDNSIPDDETLLKIQNIIDERKPIGTQVVVKAPIIRHIENVNMKITVLPNYQISQNIIKTTTKEFIDHLPIGEDFEPSALSACLFQLEGIKSIEVLRPSSILISSLEIAKIRSVEDIALEIVFDRFH